jgi:hypothetical protein
VTSAVGVAGEARRELGIGGEPVQDAGRHRGIREVGKDAVDAERVELEVLVDRIALVVGRQTLLLVAECPGVDQQPQPVGAPDQVVGGPRAAPRRSARGCN